MKKIAMLICAVLCTSITLTGCGNLSAKSSGSDASTEVAEGIKAGNSSNSSNQSASSSYVESNISKELGRELFSKKFELNGKIYTLGLSVKDLEKDGWQISDGKEQKVAASSKAENIKIKNGDFEITVVVSNTTESEISVEDGVISSITVSNNSASSSTYSSNNGTITISGGIGSNSQDNASSADDKDSEESTMTISSNVPSFTIPNDVRVGILSTDVKIALSGYQIDEKDADNNTKEYSLSKNNEYNIKIVISNSNRVNEITISI